MLTAQAEGFARRASRGAERIVDLSADHRHSEGWVYGSPEWRGLELASARRVAVPGCFATAIGLAVAPFVARGLVAGPVQVAAATGSTGSGVTPAQGTHHPERFANVKAYKVLDHQHVPEVRAFWKGLGAEPELLFVPWSLPLDRGIFATLFVPLSESVDFLVTGASGSLGGATLRRLLSDAKAGGKKIPLALVDNPFLKAYYKKTGLGE